MDETNKPVNAPAGAESALNAGLALPEDVRSFIYSVTLHLQSNRSKTPEQNDFMFHNAYRLYVKYDVEGMRANAKDEG